MHSRFVALQQPSQMIYSRSATGGVHNYVFLLAASQLSVYSVFFPCNSQPLLA